MPLGGIVSILILAPNLLFLVYPPLDSGTAKPLEKDKTFKVMEILEWVGRLGCFILPFFYALTISDYGAILAAVVMVVAYVAYLAGWLRYLRQGRRTVTLYQPMWGLSQPMAVWPVIYFWAAAVFFNSFWLILAALVLAVGHIYVSSQEYKRWK